MGEPLASIIVDEFIAAWNANFYFGKMGVLGWCMNGEKKKDDQILVGFALETTNEKQHALEKLQKKNADMIVLNSLNDTGAGFGHDTNKITVIDRNQQAQYFQLKSKSEVAIDLVNLIIDKIHEKTSNNLQPTPAL